MQNPQALPLRTTRLRTDDTRALAEAQPERRREYIQLETGEFDATLRERSYGRIGLLHERWSRALRVSCARPKSFVAFSAPLTRAPARWCGVELEPGAVLEIDHDWELTTGGAFESLSFAVEKKALERAEGLLTKGARTRHVTGNRVLGRTGLASPARALIEQIGKALEVDALAPEARAALEADLVYLAAQLRSFGRHGAVTESGSRRRAAVRRIEEYLRAFPNALPTLADLCELAGVSERTLEYAFREAIGVPPVRYLRVRRLNGVRDELHNSDPATARVTAIAMRWGFWELGRFASEYRALFGERPSAALNGRRG